MLDVGMLFDIMPLTYQLDESSEGGIKKVKLKGPLSEGDCENRNKRFYPTSLLRRELNKISADIQARRILGELDHPEDLKIHLDRVSHFVTEAHFEGNKIVGTLEVIEETPMGRILAGLVRAGANLGISSRAMGSVQRSSAGYDVVQEDFSLLTWDIVAQPSNYSSWLSLSESYKGLRRVKDLNDILEGNLKSEKSLKTILG